MEERSIVKTDDVLTTQIKFTFFKKAIDVNKKSMQNYCENGFTVSCVTT